MLGLLGLCLNRLSRLIKRSLAGYRPIIINAANGMKGDLPPMEKLALAAHHDSGQDTLMPAQK